MNRILTGRRLWRGAGGGRRHLLLPAGRGRTAGDEAGRGGGAGGRHPEEEGVRPGLQPRADPTPAVPGGAAGGAGLPAGGGWTARRRAARRRAPTGGRRSAGSRRKGTAWPRRWPGGADAWAYESLAPEGERKAKREERRFIELAIEEARKSVGEDGRAHPKVGAVVVKDGVVLATAFRGCEPTAHRFLLKVFLPPPHHPPEGLREPTAAAWLGGG
jgi:hypothetical protein